jgi:hypothetical protein
MSDDESLELKLARAARDEAEQHRKAAAKDLAEAQYLREQAARDRNEIAEIEKSVAKREKALKQAGEPEFVARLAGADKALTEAKALKADYDAAKHGAARALVEINEREKRERSEAA